jgi:D-arabinose 1-dehydrogenase-like Zn-dependent alcohol dehydrogenase
MQQHAGSFDFILDTVSANHDINAYLNLLRPDGNLTLVGAPPKPLEVEAFSLIMVAAVSLAQTLVASPRLRKCSTFAGNTTSLPMSKSSRFRRSMKLTKDYLSPM